MCYVHVVVGRGLITNWHHQAGLDTTYPRSNLQPSSLKRLTENSQEQLMLNMYTRGALLL